jgi:hypothetical protein
VEQVDAVSSFLICVLFVARSLLLYFSSIVVRFLAAADLRLPWRLGCK